MEIGFWVSAAIIVVVFLKTMIYLFSGKGSMPTTNTRYSIEAENNPTSIFYKEDDILTDPTYSDLTGNIYHSDQHDQ
jgi:uncharacterized membrane protein YdfJ with MMPL/SSD domain